MSYRPLSQDTTSEEEEEELYNKVYPTPVKTDKEELVVILDGEKCHKKGTSSFHQFRICLAYFILSLIALLLILMISYGIYRFIIQNRTNNEATHSPLPSPSSSITSHSSLLITPSSSFSPTTSLSSTSFSSSPLSFTPFSTISFSPSLFSPSFSPSLFSPSSSPSPFSPSFSPSPFSPSSSPSPFFPSSSPSSSPSLSSPSPLSSWPFTNWKYNIIGGVSELSCHLHDANHDGILDIFAVNVTNQYGRHGYYGCPNTTDQCISSHGHSPCQVRLIALSGRDGSIVWDKWVEFNIFAANCREDLNNDGNKDCLFAGRMGAFVAMDTYNHALLWVVDSNATCPSFNYYYPLFIDDLDQDGIKDIIIINGGDSRYDEDEKERSPAVLFVISGQTGQLISDRIHTPDQKESYSSPVLYNLPNTDINLILFGSGGETVSGSLWAIDMKSLADHVTSFLSTSERKTYKINKLYFHPECLSDKQLLATRPRRHYELYDKNKVEKWMSKCPSLPWTSPIWNAYSLCVYNFIPSAVTIINGGIILPPVIADVNNDKNKDLIISTFNDHTLLFDGSSKKFVWDHNQPETQTYSIPAPIYYNNDSVLDFIVRFNKGKLLNYDHSSISILDGSNGQILDTLLTCTQGNMVSPIVLRHKQKGSDGLLLIGTGCTDSLSQTRGKEKRENKIMLSLISDGMCPSNRMKFEREMCSKRHKRHEGEEEGEKEEGHTMDIIPHDKDNLISLNFDLSGYIPTDLWVARNKTDSFPDPWTDTQTFIRDYCGYDISGMSTSVYFITPQLIKEPLRPLIVYDPYVYKPPSIANHRVRNRRHLKQPTTAEIIEEVKNKLTDRKTVRCSHILLPLYSSQSPVITDFNKDGSFEGVISMTYSPIENLLNIPQLLDALHRPNIIVEAFNIEKKFKEVYGPVKAAKVNFDDYYTIEEQPWTQYMGTNGDGIFNNPK